MMGQIKQYANERRYDLLYAWRRHQYRATLPSLRSQDAGIVRDLEKNGGHVTSLDVLQIPGTAEMLRDADALFTLIAERQPPDGDFGVQPTRAEIERYTALIRWGLDPALLAIVQNYVGLPIVYRGLTVRRDIAGGEKKDTRLFHRDNEDNRIIKIIVYLNDIDERGGPFEFIPRSITPASWRIPIHDSRTSDAEMARLVVPALWQTCVGRRGTALFSDTCRVFHRGRVATTVDRRALFFCYNSAQPMSPQWCAPLFDYDAFRRAAGVLSAGQQAAITPPY